MSSGRFAAKTIPADRLGAELVRLNPSEILLPEGYVHADLNTLKCALTRRADWQFDAERGRRLLLDQFGVGDLAAFGIEDQPALQAAAGLLLEYARHTQQAALPHIASLTLEQDSEYVLLDAAARRTLEISETLRGEPAPTLFSELDRCLTALGSRRLKHWLHHPLRDRAVLRRRHAAIAALMAAPEAIRGAREALKGMADLERIAARIALKSARPRDLSGLRDSLLRLPALQDALLLAGPDLADLIERLIFPAESLDHAGARAEAGTRRRCCAKAASSPTASTPNSTNCARCNPIAAAFCWTWKRASGRAPASPRCASNTTACPAFSSKSAAPRPTRFRPTITAARR